MSLAWHGIRLRKRMRTPTFWLALVHISLMCCVKLRFLSIFTPNSLICSVFMISSLAMVRTLPFLCLFTSLLCCYRYLMPLISRSAHKVLFSVPCSMQKPAPYRGLVYADLILSRENSAKLVKEQPQTVYAQIDPVKTASVKISQKNPEETKDGEHK